MRKARFCEVGIPVLQDGEDVNIELARALDSIDGEDAAKIHVVMEAVKAAFEKITDLGIDWESFRPLVEKIIDPILKLIRSKV